jgi:lactoylglutathione lyase
MRIIITNHTRTLVIALLLHGLTAIFAQNAASTRPKITGISNVGYFVSDLSQALYFWHDFLGFDESLALKKTDSQDVRIARSTTTSTSNYSMKLQVIPPAR